MAPDTRVDSDEGQLSAMLPLPVIILAMQLLRSTTPNYLYYYKNQTGAKNSCATIPWVRRDSDPRECMDVFLFFQRGTGNVRRRFAPRELVTPSRGWTLLSIERSGVRYVSRTYAKSFGYQTHSETRYRQEGYVVKTQMMYRYSEQSRLAVSE